MRTISLTGEKLKALYFLSDKLTSDEKIAKYFENACAVENAKGLVESYLEAARRDGLITKEYENKYGKYPENVAPAEVKEAMQKARFAKVGEKALSSVDKNDRREFLEFLLIIAETKETVKNAARKSHRFSPQPKTIWSLTTKSRRCPRFTTPHAHCTPIATSIFSTKPAVG